MSEPDFAPPEWPRQSSAPGNNLIAGARNTRRLPARGFAPLTEQLAKAREQLAEQGRPPEPGRLVATLTFGFWTALLNKEYEELWRATLHHAMHSEARDEKGHGLTRKNLTRLLTPLRELRNWVAHHEPILAWNLPRHHEAILRITGWLSPAAEQWTRRHSRFPIVHPAERIALALPDRKTPA